MVSIAKEVISERSKVDKNRFSDPTVLRTGFSKIIGITVALVDYVTGMTLGAIGGWVIGYCLGYIFLDIFEPTRLESFEAVHYWYYLPLSFGHCGALIAAGISMPLVYLLSKRHKRHQMAQNSKNAVNKPENLANATEASPAQMQRALKRLSQKQQGNYLAYEMD